MSESAKKFSKGDGPSPAKFGNILAFVDALAFASFVRFLTLILQSSDVNLIANAKMG